MPVSPPLHRPLGVRPAQKRTDPFYGTQAWKRMRSEALKRDGFRCVRCERKNDRLIVHHIVERKNGGLDALSNLETVCGICHALDHGTPTFAGRR